LGWSEANLSLTLVNDRAMARLNRETFGRRGPTNVIAFPVDVEDLKEFRGRGQGPMAPAPSPKTPPPTPTRGLAMPEGGTCRGTACRTLDTVPPSPSGATTGRAPETGESSPPPLLGEVVISLETTRRQARENGWPWEELFDFFLIHGILHTLGYDHAAPLEEDRMTAKTWELLRLLHPGIVE